MLFWGILGVLVLRAIMIGLGAAIVANFAWMLYVFAAFLIATGVKMLVVKDRPYDVGANPVLAFVRRRLAVTDGLQGERFFVRQPHRTTGEPAWHITPLFLALLLIEVADIIFAVGLGPCNLRHNHRSVHHLYVKYIRHLGLRALYFALAAMVDRFHYLKYALAAVLVFIGSKIFIADLLAIDNCLRPCRSG